MSKKKLNDINDKKISVLNKIKHKPILLDNIFPFIEKRAMIFPFLINSDLFLKEKIKPIIEPASVNNKLSKNINDNICRFIFSRLLYEIKFESINNDIKNKIINCSNEDESFIPSYIYNIITIDSNLNKCIIKYICEKLTESLKQKINNIINIDVKYSNNLENFYKSNSNLDYINDSLNVQKEITLYHLPVEIKIEKNEKIFDTKCGQNKDKVIYEVEDEDEDEDENENENQFEEENKNSSLYGDSFYLEKLNKNLNQKIDLICKIDSNFKYYENPTLIEYNNIHKLFFLFFEDVKNNDNKSVFNKINNFLIKIKHKENIEEMYFNNIFFNEEKKGEFYQKTYFENFFNEFEKYFGNNNLIFKSLKKIEFNDDKIKNNIRRFKLRYNLNKIFGIHLWSQVKIIHYKDIKNILSNKNEEKPYYIMNNFIDENTTNLKIFLIDLENNSPYQKIFYDFCKAFLDNNENINMIIFHGIGNINYDDKFDKNFKKIIIPNISDIFYEREINEKNSNNQIYTFIESFFDIKKLFMVYEGYDDNNNLNYLNISSNNILEDEINRIILDEQKVYSFHLKREKIQIKYNRKKNHLLIKNNNNIKEREKKNLCNNLPLSFFSNIIRGLNNLQKLTINGFDFSFYDIINNNISVLSINALNEFASKNFKHINKYNKKDFENDWKDFKSYEYLQLFQNLKYFIISEKFQFLQELPQYLQKNNCIKKIRFYTSEKVDKKKLSKIKNEIIMKDICLELVQANKENMKYENEEKEEENFYEKNKIIYNPKKKFIQNKNWFDSFNSQILQKLGIDYIKRIISFFSKIFPKGNIQPYHFCLLNRYEIQEDKKKKLYFDHCTYEENILRVLWQKNNLLIIFDDMQKKGDYQGFFKAEYLNNSKIFYFYDDGNNDISFQEKSFLELYIHYYNLNFIEVFEVKIN